VYIASLRRKLELKPGRPRFILTEPGLGFRLCSERPASDENLLADDQNTMTALEDPTSGSSHEPASQSL
jgi:hypothetical protein